MDLKDLVKTQSIINIDDIIENIESEHYHINYNVQRFKTITLSDLSAQMYQSSENLGAPEFLLGWNPIIFLR